MMELDLKNTVELMLSEDYKDRFKAEYWQTFIRYTKLRNMVKNWDNLNFKPTCSKAIYLTQLQYMDCYLETLEARAEIEGIELK